MTVDLEYLRLRAAELQRAGDVLSGQLNDFFRGRRVRVTSLSDRLVGKVFPVHHAAYWNGKVLLYVYVRGQLLPIMLERVHLVTEELQAREAEHA